FGKMQKYKKKAVVKYREGIQYGFEKLDVEIVYGTAVLRSDRTVEVELKEGGREFYRGKAVIIATGAVPYMSRIPGSNLSGVWNSDR
ncbi:hypothetical protein LIZ31_17420, partial [Eggerthella lenta]|nr:hypothetical protein [Eggerthella lenta]